MFCFVSNAKTNATKAAALPGAACVAHTFLACAGKAVAFSAFFFVAATKLTS
jgi:hypothetical protein